MTRVPVGGFPYAAGEWRWTSAWFPLVGLVVGTVCAAVWWLVAPLGPWVAAMAVLVASILLTGAFHEDGLADTADALGGAHDRAKIFVILKDSRVGAFGALALVVSIAFRLVLLARLADVAPVAVLLAHCLARVGPVWLMVAMPYVSDAAAKSRQVTRAGAAQGVLATAIGLAVAGGVVLAAGGMLAGGGALAAGGALAGGAIDATAAVAALGAMALATAFCGWRFHARAGGLTGDFLGAAEQVNEIVILFTILAVLRVAGFGP